MLSWRQTPVHPRSRTHALRRNGHARGWVILTRTAIRLVAVNLIPSLACAHGCARSEAEAAAPIGARVTEARVRAQQGGLRVSSDTSSRLACRSSRWRLLMSSDLFD